MDTNLKNQLKASDCRLLNINKAAEYLTNRGWFEKRNVGRGLVRVFERLDNKLIQARLPAVNDLDDYERVTAEALEVIADQENRGIIGLFNDILFFSEDVLEIREKTVDAANGTISLRRAAEMFSGIRSTIASAAMLEIAPKPYYIKQRRVDVDNFISQCRFGQTGRGSYVMTVMCPLNAMPQESGLNTESLFDPQFSRRITTRLYNSVATIVQAATDDNYDAVIKPDTEYSTINSNLCDAILQMAPEADGAVLDFGIRWAKKQPVDNGMESAKFLSLRSEHRAFITIVSAQLRRMAEAETPKSFFGTISTLDGKMDAEGRRYGLIYAQLTNREEDETFTAKIDLSYEDFAKA